MTQSGIYSDVRFKLYGAVNDLTVDQWNTIKAGYDDTCAYCNRQSVMTIDHRLPLSRGGQHSAPNILPCCWTCNTAKSTKTEEEYRRWLAAPKNLASILARPSERPRTPTKRERGTLPEAYLTVTESARLLGCSVGRIYYAIRVGQMAVIIDRKANQLLIAPAEVKRYAASHREPGRPRKEGPTG